MDERVEIFERTCQQCSGQSVYFQGDWECPLKPPFRKCEVLRLACLTEQGQEPPTAEILQRLIRPAGTSSGRETVWKKALQVSLQQTKKLLILYSGAGMRCSGGGQRPTQMAWELSKDRTVIFVCIYETLSLGGNLFSCTPDQFALLDLTKGPRPVGIVAFPDAHGLQLAQWIQDQDGLLIYDCLDFWPGFREPMYLDPHVEAILASSAHLALAVSRPLVEYLRFLGAGRVEYLPNAAAPSAWRPAPEPPADLRRGTVATLIYSGHLGGSWLDLELISVLAEEGRERGWSVNLIGGPPPDLDGAAYLGPKSYRDLGRYLRYADVGFIPFQENLLTRCVSPLKVYDYLAAGLPVVSTPMPELDSLPGVRQASGPGAFVQAVEAVLRDRPPRAALERFSQNHTWVVRVRQLKGWLEEKRSSWRVPADGGAAALLEQMEARLAEGLYRPEVAKQRVAWLSGTSCNYHCPYCYARSKIVDKPFTPASAKAAWNRWTERNGPAQIVCSGQESMHDPEVREVLATLSESNILDINTNFSFDLADLTEFQCPDHVYFSASYHPSSGVSLTDFIAKVGEVRQRRFHVTGISCVLYPPYLERVRQYRDQVRAAGIYFLAHPFQGDWRGQDYPAAYTEEELTVVRELVDDQSWSHNIEIRNTFGLLCWAGARYGYINWDGRWRRCDNGLAGDNFFTTEIRLEQQPQPCPSRGGCHCNDLWRYILSREEGEALCSIVPK